MIRATRIINKNWHELLDGFVHDSNLAAGIKAKSPR
jgi:hypothetical protein|tara:strand:+ start:1724 stop:1831 length:108 start_codon:yes stop_codon:yes gene_type:complete